MFLCLLFFFNDTATTEIYTLSLHDALPIFRQQAIALGRLFTIAANVTDPDAYFLGGGVVEAAPDFRDWFLATDRKSTRLNSSHVRNSYAVFFFKKKKK